MRYLAEAAEEDGERESFRHYVADSLHYQAQGMYLAYKWGTRRKSDESEVPDPLDVAISLSEKYGIEVKRSGPSRP